MTYIKLLWQLHQLHRAQVGAPVAPRRYRDWSKEVKLKVKRPDLTTPTTAMLLLKTDSNYRPLHTVQ